MINPKDFKVEAEWDIGELHCLAIFTKMGHRCGYVGVPKGHWLYGLGYSEEKYFNAIEDIISVHGGITFADCYEPVTADDYWYFGFDCAHYDDAPDLNAAYEYGFGEPWHSMVDDGSIRTLEYVKKEITSMAEQINKLGLRDKIVAELYIKD